MSLYSKRNVSIATMFWQNCLFQIWFLFVCLFLNDDATIFFCFRHCCIDFVEFWVILDGFLTFFQQSKKLSNEGHSLVWEGMVFQSFWSKKGYGFCQPRSQGFSLEGRRGPPLLPSSEKPWERGWVFALSLWIECIFERSYFFNIIDKTISKYPSLNDV